MKYKLSKKLVYHLVEEEVKVTGLKIEAHPVTAFENIKEIILDGIEDKKISSTTVLEMIKDILNEIKDSKNCYGNYNPLRNKLKIMLTILEKNTDNVNDYLWNLIITIYHEIGHIIIKTEPPSKRDDLTNFYLSIDCLANEINEYYEQYHDNFYEEILANNYGIEKGIKFLKEYPNVYRKLYLYIKNISFLNQINYQNYDVQQHFYHINKNVKSYDNKPQLFKLGYPYTIIRTLYNKDGRFKSLSELSQNEEWNNNYTKEMKRLIISSRAYLDDLNYDELTKEEKEQLLDALYYVYYMEKNRMTQNQKLRKNIESFILKIIKSKQILSYNESLLTILIKKEKRNKLKLRYLEKQIDKLTPKGYHQSNKRRP